MEQARRKVEMVKITRGVERSGGHLGQGVGEGEGERSIVISGGERGGDRGW